MLHLHSQEYIMSVKMAVFWVVAPCSLVVVYQRFRVPCCLHHQGDKFSSVNFYQTTRSYNPEDTHLRTPRRENLESYYNVNIFMLRIIIKRLWIKILINHILLCDISGSYGGEYENGCLWVVVTCRLVEVHQRFRGACCRHHQDYE
jgi:hypothetical protein